MHTISNRNSEVYYIEQCLHCIVFSNHWLYFNFWLFYLTFLIVNIRLIDVIVIILLSGVFYRTTVQLTHALPTDLLTYTLEQDLYQIHYIFAHNGLTQHDYESWNSINVAVRIWQIHNRTMKVACPTYEIDELVKLR